MISFFRKIRHKLLQENRITRYLTYAVGEILLVVIGILIALAINTWNEERKNRILEIKYLSDLISDLQKDSTTLTSLAIEATETARIKAKLQNYFLGAPIELDSLPIFFDSQWFPYQVFIPTQITLEEMKNSGRLDLIGDRNLKRKLIELSDQYELLYQDEVLFLSSTRKLQEFGRAYLEDIDHPTVKELIPFFMKREIRNNIRVNYANGRKRVAIETLEKCNHLIQEMRYYLSHQNKQ